MDNRIRTGDPVDSIKDVVRSSMKVPDFEKHLKKAGGHIGQNVVETAIKMKTIVRKHLMVKTSGDKRKILKDFPSRTIILLETKLYSRNLIKRINTFVVPIV